MAQVSQFWLADHSPITTETINSDGTLTLGDTAVVSGNMNVGSVVVRGKVSGNINAKDKIEIKTKAELFGDIRSSKLVIEEGVTFVGKTEINPSKVIPPGPHSSTRTVSANVSKDVVKV
jgi:cytoskeletal protein CcmA (bactofilin family)